MTPQLLAVAPEATPPALRDVRTGAPLSPEDAAARISAYVYGNMVVLATLASLTQDAMTSGHAALVVAGVAASTFLAHAVADGIGRRLRPPLRGVPSSRRTVLSGLTLAAVAAAVTVTRVALGH